MDPPCALGKRVLLGGNRDSADSSRFVGRPIYHPSRIVIPPEPGFFVRYHSPPCPTTNPPEASTSSLMRPPQTPPIVVEVQAPEANRGGSPSQYSVEFVASGERLRYGHALSARSITIRLICRAEVSLREKNG